MPVLTVLVTSNQAGPVDVAVLVDGASQASAQTLLPEAAPTVVVSQAVQASGGTQLITDLTGRFATLPAMWVWWVDDLGAVSVPAADPTDEWLCRPASSGRPTSIPKSADKCSFMGDPRRLTSLRYTTKDSAHHVLHVVVDIGGLLTETTVDVPIP